MITVEVVETGAVQTVNIADGAITSERPGQPLRGPGYRG